MRIRVFSKDGCGKCEAAKEKLERFGLEYEEHSLAYHIERNPGWRERKDFVLVAQLASTGKALGECLPTIEIDGVCYDYSGAMKVIKHFQKRWAENILSPDNR